MHSWALVRKPTSNTSYRILAGAQSLNLRQVFTQSNNPSSSLKSNGESSYKKSDYVRESLWSSIYVVGLSLGLCYWSSLPDSNSRLSFADSQPQATEPEKKPKFIFGDAYRRKVFFKYEKRIRTQSPPEKVCIFTTKASEDKFTLFLLWRAPYVQVFEYFASYHSPDGEVFMMPEDLMRAVVPVFPPSETARVRGGSLKGEWIPCELLCAPSRFFMLFDTNNDGVISFAEYIFFVTLLSIPESSFSVAFKMFDLDHNGKIDREEFKKVMALMRSHNRQGARHRDGLRNGLKVSGSVENGGLLEYFFGKDGKGFLDHETFVQFLRDLQNEILRLEFAHYDCKAQGTISAKDFALSMVASADMKHIDKFLDRIDKLENELNLKDIRITFDEFKNLAELRKRLRPLSLAIFSYGKVNGLLTKKDFQRAAYHVCGIPLTDNVVDMIFYVFDANRDGSLSYEEFLRVLQRREGDNLQPREAGFVGLISCWFECTNNCSSSRILL